MARKSSQNRSVSQLVSRSKSKSEILIFEKFEYVKVCFSLYTAVTVGSLFHVEWCIRLDQTCSSGVLAYYITTILILDTTLFQTYLSSVIQDAYAGKVAISSLLGGMGYFHGVPRLGDAVDVRTGDHNDPMGIHSHIGEGT